MIWRVSESKTMGNKGKKGIKHCVSCSSAQCGTGSSFWNGNLFMRCYAGEGGAKSEGREKLSVKQKMGSEQMMKNNKLPN